MRQNVKIAGLYHLGHIVKIGREIFFCLVLSHFSKVDPGIGHIITVKPHRVYRAYHRVKTVFPYEAVRRLIVPDSLAHFDAVEYLGFARDGKNVVRLLFRRAE